MPDARGECYLVSGEEGKIFDSRPHWYPTTVVFWHNCRFKEGWA